jgi:hypothetical protein
MTEAYVGIRSTGTWAGAVLLRRMGCRQLLRRSQLDAIPAAHGGMENVAATLHHYPDKDNSGVTQDEAQDIALLPDGTPDLDIGIKRCQAATDWARANGVKLVLGEYGYGRDANSVEALRRLQQFLKANGETWLAGTYWAAGPWSGSYIRAVDYDRPNQQLAALAV